MTMMNFKCYKRPSRVTRTQENLCAAGPLGQLIVLPRLPRWWGGAHHPLTKNPTLTLALKSYPVPFSAEPPLKNPGYATVANRTLKQ